MKKTTLAVLILALLLSLSAPAFAFTAKLSGQALSVNGEIIDCERYNIDGSNYFKLRDLAQLLNGTESQFDVGYDNAKKLVTITTSHAYTTPNGQELVVGEDKSETAKVSTQTIVIDGTERSDLTVYNIGGSNFFQLRDMGDALGFDVDYDSETRTMLVKSREIAPEESVTVSLDVIAFGLLVGEQKQLTATVIPEGKTVAWSSGNTAIATVDENGLVTAVGEGKADIFAEVGNQRVFCTVTVNPGTISLDVIAVGLKIGETRQLTVTTTPAGEAVSWGSGNTGIATVDANGLVTAVSEGKVVIFAVAGSKKAYCTVTVVPAPIIYSGYGDDVITGISVPAGIYRVKMTNSGKEHFSVITYDENGKYGDLLANASGAPFAGEAIFRDGKTTATANWSMEVSSKSNWTIEISKITEKSTTNMSGSGSIVTGLFSGNAFCTVSMTNSGSEHFSVIIYNSNGKYESLLANTSGSSYSGRKTFTLKSGNEYFLVIESKSEWSVDFGLGDALTTYERPVAATGSDAGGSGSDSGSGGSNSDNDKKYSYTDATNLNNYAQKATSATNSALDYCNKAYDNKSLASLYFSQAVSKANDSRTYLGWALEILNNRVELDLTNSDYATLRELVQANYDRLDEVNNVDLSADTWTVYSSLTSILSKAGAQNISFEKITVELLKAFT